MREATIAGSVDLLVDNRGRNPEFAVSGTPYLSGQSCSKGSIDWEHTRFVTSETAERLLPGGLRRGDVLLTSEAPMGVPVWVGADHAAVPGQRLFMLRANSDVIEPRFLYYSLKTQPFQAQLAGGATGTTVLGIRQPVLAQARLMLPSLRQQRAVAEVLGALDDKIAANERVAAGTDQLLAAVFERAAAAAGTTVVPVAQEADVNPEVASPGDGPLRYLDIAGVSVGDYEWPEQIQWSQAPGRARRRLRSGDVVWSSVRPNRRSHALVLDDQTDLVGSTGLAVLRARDVHWSYLYEATRRQAFTEWLMSSASGSAYPVVAPTLFKQAPLEMVPDTERAAFEKLAAPLRESVHKQRGENRRLAALRDALLPELMSGRLTVRDAESQVEEVV